MPALTRARLLYIGCRMPCQLRRRLGSDLRKPPERLQHFAPCDVPTSHPAMSQLRTLRSPNFAPCDVLTSHPAKFQVRTLQSFKFAPCEVLSSHRAKFARRLGVPVHRLVGYVRELGRAAMSAEMRAPCLLFFMDFSLLVFLVNPPRHHAAQGLPDTVPEGRSWEMAIFP